ncbi:MAG TPA: hypothetical protein VLR26_05115 [Frankiaceae bacterium]|nr:hypothetical protein [Frankiaceae bacterium]
MAKPITALVATTPRLQRMPRKEIRALGRDPFSSCLEELVDALESAEQIESLTCATSASRGRGVLALTGSRLLLCTKRTGLSEWRLAAVDSVRGRPANFTLPPAIYLDADDRMHVVLVGAGRRWGPVFTEDVRVAHFRVGQLPLGTKPAVAQIPAPTQPVATVSPVPAVAA